MAYITNVIKQSEGDTIFINDSYKLKELILNGNTTQNGTPTPTSPIAVETVTGRQDIEVCEKNLFKAHEGTTITSVNVQFTRNDDGTITINGTANGNGFVEILYAFQNGTSQQNNIYIPLDSSSTYTASFKQIDGTTTTSDVRFITQYDSTGNQQTIYINNSQTISNSNGLYRAYIRIPSGATFNNYTVGIQLEKGQATTYEEYKGNTYEINLGKNIANIYLGGKEKGTTQTINGVTFTINNDGTISGSGTATAQSNFIFYGSWSGNGLNIPIDRNSYYHFSSNGTKDSQSRDNGYFYVRVAKIKSDGTLYYSTVNNNSSFTGYDYINLIMLTVGQGVTVDFNGKWCQIEKGNQATPFVEYKTPTELCKIGNYKDFIRKGTGENLCNYQALNLVTNGNGTTSTVNGYYNVIIDTENMSSLYVSGNFALLNSSTLRVGGYDTYPAVGVNGTRYSITSNNSFSTGSHKYIMFSFLANTGYTIDDIKNSFMINEGNSALPYEPYGYKDKWYLYKTIGKVVLNGSESWAEHGNTTNNIHTYYRYVSGMFKSRTQLAYSDYFYYLAGCWSVSNKAEGQFSGETNGAFYFNSSINNLADFKTWLSTHNTSVYYVLATPTTTEITDTELINQLDLIKLQLGINNITVDSNNLSSPIKLEYYSTENPYVDAIYSQQEKNDLKIWFDDVELEDAGRYCESITRTARILPDNGEKRFCLDTFYSTNLTVILHNVDLSIIKDQVRIEIGTDLGNNEYKYIPLGIFNIQDSPEINKNKITLKLRDNRVKFEFNYDAQPLIESLGGTATKKQILNDICEQAGVVNTINSFANEDDEVALYDNTIEAQTYVSYLMEQAGLIPTINRYGQLIKIDLSDLYVWRIPLSLLEGWEKGEPYKIERVVYESGIIKYETDSDENLDTLYINSANPYIFSVAQVEGILNKLKDFEIDSVLTKRVLGNPAIDPYDIIEVYNDLDGTNNIVFRTLANTTYKFNGVHRDTFETQIGKESRTENVTKNSTNDNFKRIFTNINQLEGKIELNATETAKNTALINSQGEQIDSLGTIVTQTVENITASVTSIQEELANGVNLVKTTTVTVDDEGLTVATDNSKTTTIMTSDKFAVRSGGKDLAFFGYDDEIGSTKAEMDNLTVTNYFVAGYHRTEKYDVGLEHRTGVFYIGE